ncbi:MAG: hypothetical protein CMH55_08165 [Myxococcales bacterium]|nr:hypothetical protein [Myxococcales bacterium]
MSLEGRREAQLVEQLSAAVGRLSEDEAAAAALEAQVAEENARMQPKSIIERVQEQMTVGVPQLLDGLKRGWTPQVAFSGNDRRWGLGLGVEWDVPASTNSLVLELSYVPDSPCLCEGGNFSAYGLDFELGMRRYLWRKGSESSTSKTDHSGLFVDGHYRRGQLSWTQEGGIPISRSRSQWGLGLGWRQVLDAGGLTSTLRIAGDVVTGNASPAAWGSELLLWRANLGFGYRL